MRGTCTGSDLRNVVFRAVRYCVAMKVTGEDVVHVVLSHNIEHTCALFHRYMKIAIIELSFFMSHILRNDCLFNVTNKKRNWKNANLNSF